MENSSLPKKADGRRRRIISFGIVAILLTAAGLVWKFTRGTDLSTTRALADSEVFWQEFRQKNPGNIQIAAIRHYDDGSMNILLSEPSPEITAEKLQDFFDRYNARLSYFKASMGYDGWLKDVVVSVADVSDDKLDKLAAELFKLLYFTDYKAQFLNFDRIPEQTAYSSSDLDISVSEEELRDWLIDNAETFSKPEGTGNEPVTSLMSRQITGVYHSDKPGLIAWVLPKYIDNVTTFRSEARQFSLDSDLILGAVASDWSIAIIGRERQESVFDLPPLRAETLEIFATTESPELSQSYETNIFTGKLDGKEGGKDWHHIMLSDELWHTEYGSLLNLADQLLKTWSENGAVEFDGYNYPNPSSAIFDNGLAKELDASSLTYNWNTDGAGYIVEDANNGYSIYALNRTGSLPVSYIPDNIQVTSPDNTIYRAEELAYDFFASLSNTTLARVVQYTAIYQIFRNFGISLNKANTFSEYDSERMSLPKENPRAAIPLEMLSSACRVLTLVSDLTIDSLIDPYLKFLGNKNKIPLSRSEFDRRFSVEGNDLVVNPEFRLVNTDISGAHFSQIFKTADEGYFITFLNLQNLSDLSYDIGYYRTSEGFLWALAEYSLIGSLEHLKELYEAQPADNPVARMRERIHASLSETMGYDDEEDNVDHVAALIETMSKPGVRAALSTYARRLDPRISTSHFRDLLCSENRDNSAEWIKTPTVAMSVFTTDSINVTGGHNIRATATRFRVNPKLSPGKINKIVRGREVIYEIAADMRGRLSAEKFIRGVARLNNTEVSSSARALRPRTQVISAAKRVERGAGKAAFEIRASAGRYTVNGKPVTLTELLDDVATHLSSGKAPFKEIVITDIDRAGVNIKALIDGVAYRMPRGPGAKLQYDIAGYTTEIAGDRAIVRVPLRAADLNSVFRGGNVKEAYATFNMPKSRLEQFIAILRQYLQQQRQRWNKFRLERQMRQRGIDPSDIMESTHLRIAIRNIDQQNTDRHVKLIETQAIA